MEKVAILSRGTETFPGENENDFYSSLARDVKIMDGIAKDAGYKVVEVPLSEVSGEMKKYSCDDVMVYYSGHGKEFFNGYDTGVLEGMSEFLGDKKLILDACCGNKLEQMALPENSLVVGANEVPPSKSIAKMLWDYTVPYKGDLDDLSQESFDEMKHNWVQVVKN